jgi:hypothetical protein
LKDEKKLRNIFSITQSTISLPDELFVAFGLSDGTISIWNTSSLSL